MGYLGRYLCSEQRNRACPEVVQDTGKGHLERSRNRIHSWMMEAHHMSCCLSRHQPYERGAFYQQDTSCNLASGCKMWKQWLFQEVGRKTGIPHYGAQLR